MHQLLLAAMKCPVCGETTSTDDTRTNMQVAQFPGTDEPYIHEGDRFRMGFSHVPHLGFEVVREPAVGAPFLLLVPWTCPFCSTPDLWALMEMQPEGEWSTVRSIRPVDRTPDLVGRVNAISELIVMDGTWPP